MEKDISGISKFPAEKKDNLERWTEIFEMNFRKISVPFDLIFWTGISGNFGRKEHAPRVRLLMTVSCNQGARKEKLVIGGCGYSLTVHQKKILW